MRGYEKEKEFEKTYLMPYILFRARYISGVRSWVERILNIQGVLGGYMYGGEIADVLLSLSKAVDANTWFSALAGLGREYGFEYTNFVLLPGNCPAPRKEFSVSNHGVTWKKLYEQRRFLQIDPLLKYCLTHMSPRIWDYREFTHPSEQALYQEASLYGLRRGVAFPLHAAQGYKGMLCFASSDLSLESRCESERSVPVLALIRDVALESAIPHVRKRLSGDAPQLTRRETECLKWICMGKTAWETAQILNVHHSTVAYHLSNVRQKMGVSNKSAAVAKAMTLGLLEVSV